MLRIKTYALQCKIFFWKCKFFSKKKPDRSRDFLSNASRWTDFSAVLDYRCSPSYADLVASANKSGLFTSSSVFAREFPIWVCTQIQTCSQTSRPSCSAFSMAAKVAWMPRARWWRKSPLSNFGCNCASVFFASFGIRISPRTFKKHT